MKRFVDSLARQRGIKPPPGYTKSGLICRKFLDQHAPKKAETAGKPAPKPASPAQMLFAEKIAREKGVVVSDEAKASSAAMSAWIETNLGAEGHKRRKTASIPPKSTMPELRASKKRPGTRNSDAAPPTPAR
jgi:DNA topoisomerase III